MATADHPMTAEELLRPPDDGYRYELVRGELRKMAPAGHEHGRIAMNIAVPLAQYVRAHGLGAVYAAATGFPLATNPDTARAPDAAFVRRHRLAEADDVEGYWPGAPDLAVEVISPSDTYAEAEDKVLQWLEAGTRLVVVVHPRRRVIPVDRSLSQEGVLTEGDVLAGGDVVPGWTLPVGEIFAWPNRTPRRYGRRSLSAAGSAHSKRCCGRPAPCGG
jgi:Uma2 family endonuclease